MSYCRWSTDDFQCDLYCYESTCGGFTTHVASSKIMFTEPLPPEVDLLEDVDGYMQRHNKVMELVKTSPKEPIGLPYDGQSFNDPDLQSFLARLEQLKAAGYRFPDSVIEAVKAEIAHNGG